MARIAPNVGPFRMKGLDIFVETVNYTPSSESDDVPGAATQAKCSLCRFCITCRRDPPCARGCLHVRSCNLAELFLQIFIVLFPEYQGPACVRVCARARSVRCG